MAESSKRKKSGKNRGKNGAAPRKHLAPVQDPAGVDSVAFVSLGCPKNLVDSERMLGLLAADGIGITSDHSSADVIVINTCGFLEASRQEGLSVIHEALETKEKAARTGRPVRVVVAGCLVQRDKSRLLEDAPGIDALVGVFDRENIVRAVRGPANNLRDADRSMGTFHAVTQMISRHDRSKAGYREQDDARLRLTPRHYAYLRVSEGCNQGCTFCTIPSIRGRMRSKPVEQILREARELIDDGAFELNLIGQDTTSYGTDIGYDGPGQGLSGMLNALDTLRGAGWLRLMYAYPSCFADDMIRTIADAPHLVKYIDMPLQHINDDILHAMRRKVTRREIEILLEKLRRWIPGMAVRTTLISGFPGETEAQHRELLAFVKDFEFDCLGVFEYSPEPQTPAGRLWAECGVANQVSARRKEELMLAQQDIVRKKNKAMIGRVVDVLVDSVNKTARTAVGRHAGQAPEIDGQVFIQGCEASPGEILQVSIEEFDCYDLTGRMTGVSRAAPPRVALPVVG